MDVLNELVQILESKKLKELYAEFGIDHYREVDQAMVPLDVATMPGKITFRKNWARQAVIGSVGTYIIDGRLRVEANHRVSPHFARGRRSVPGLLEKIYRSEPVVFNSVNSTAAITRSATWEPTPTGAMDPDTVAITARAHNAVMGIRSGFRTFANDASSTLPKIGFAPFEGVWDECDDGVWLDDLLFREPATVERWIYNSRGQDLVGSEFTVSGDSYFNYFLPFGDTPETSRLHVATINRSGNNIEGVAPTRVASGIRALKELLLNVSGLSYQKYGVPIIQVIADLVSLNAAQLAGQAESSAEVQALLNRLNNLAAQIAPVLRVPAGFKVDVASPTNTMPDIRPMLEYLDALMALCFANEGSVLGTGGFGSYALASVADNRFMRVAPLYAEAISDLLTRLLHQMIRWNHPDPSKIVSLPEYSYRFAGTQDASKWANDMALLINAQVWTWPDEPRHHAATNMGLAATAFDDWGPAATPSPDISGQQDAPAEGEPNTEPDETVEKIAETAMNGAQIASLVQVVQAISAGELPADSGIAIIKKAFQVDEAQARELIGSSGNQEQVAA